MPDHRTDRFGHALRVLVVLGIVGGIVVRVILIPSTWGVFESDEATMGLMARHILRGELPIFLWGQEVGGSIEAFLIAGVFGIFGSSVLAIRLVPFGLAAVAALLVWRIGRRVLSPEQGAAAALLVWLWPAPFVWWAIRMRGFYWSTIVAGLMFILAVLRVAERPNRRDAVWAGLAAGIGWWTAPQITMFAIPATVWVVLRRRRAVPVLLAFGGAAFVFGAAPWIAYNLRHDFVSLNPPPIGPMAGNGYVDHLRGFAVKGLPMALGARLPFTFEWVPGGKVLFIAGVGALAYAAAVRRPPIVPLGLAVFPFVHAVSPLSYYLGEGRYFTYYGSFLALALASVARRRLTLALLVSGLFVLTLYGFAQLNRSGNAPYAHDIIPRHFGSLIDDLENRGLTHVYAEYWIAYRLTFESEERIVVAILPEAASRHEDYDRAVYGADRTAYVYPAGSVQADALRTELRVLALTWQEHRVGGFQVIIPDRAFISPQQVVPPAGMLRDAQAPA